MENEIKAVRVRAAVMGCYADMLDTLKSKMTWYQTFNDETQKWEDDDNEDARINLEAIREAAKAIRKLAGA